MLPGAADRSRLAFWFVCYWWLRRAAHSGRDRMRAKEKVRHSTPLPVVCLQARGVLWTCAAESWLGTGAKLAGGAESAIEWAERVTQKQQQGDDVDGNAGRTKPPEPDATPQEHRTLTAGDLSYDFLSKMGFVPPPPPPPWGFNKKNGSTSEIEERIMR